LPEADLLDLIGEIYDCAIEPAKWPLVLERVATQMGATHAAIALHNINAPDFTLQANWRVPPEFEQSMKEHLATNPFISAAWYQPIGEPMSAFRFYGEEELKRSRWFKITHEPHQHGDSALLLLARSVSRFGSFSVHRRSWQPVFSDEELSLLRILSPHIRRAALISDMLGSRTLERDMLAVALNRLDVGVVLTDGNGRIVHANEAVNRYLDEATSLRRIDGLLAACDATSAREFAQAIADAASGTAIDLPQSGIVVPLKGQDGRDLAAWVLPLDGGLRRQFGAGSAARVATFIRELEDTSPFPAELFVRRYAITPAECRVMMLLVQGQTIAEAAEALGIALATARTHLARLFEKTGTSRQVDLVRMAMTAFAPATTHPRK
jgi:DNA-binding CsgD family transcriptional regulator/PAS domain-containing protein